MNKQSVSIYFIPVFETRAYEYNQYTLQISTDGSSEIRTGVCNVTVHPEDPNFLATAPLYHSRVLSGLWMTSWVLALIKVRSVVGCVRRKMGASCVYPSLRHSLGTVTI